MIHIAIRNVHSNVAVVTGTTVDDVVCKNTDGNSVTIDKSAVTAECNKLQAEYDAQEYARNRASAFPSIGDQLDMQYHDQLDGTTTWKDAIAKVKSDNPKE